MLSKATGCFPPPAHTHLGLVLLVQAPHAEPAGSRGGDQVVGVGRDGDVLHPGVVLEPRRSGTTS